MILLTEISLLKIFKERACRAVKCFVGRRDCSRCAYYVRSCRTWIKAWLPKVKWRSGSWTGSDADKKESTLCSISNMQANSVPKVQNTENRKHFLRFSSKVKPNLIHLKPSILHNRTLKWVSGTSTVIIKSLRPFTEVDFWINGVLVCHNDVLVLPQQCTCTATTMYLCCHNSVLVLPQRCTCTATTMYLYCHNVLLGSEFERKCLEGVRVQSVLQKMMKLNFAK